MRKVKFNLDLIKKIKEAQEFIFIEDSRNVVESECRETELTGLINETNMAFQKQKKYYHIVRKIINAYENANAKSKGRFKASDEITVQEIDILDQICSKRGTEKIQEKRLKIPSLLEITRNVFDKAEAQKISKQKLKTQSPADEFVDILTFSFIPSYFHFFWANYSLIRFMHFLFLLRNDKYSLNDQQYDQIARVAFVTPAFRHYCEIALQPLFTKFLDVFLKAKSGKQLAAMQEIAKDEKIFEILGQYSYLIPKEVFIVTDNYFSRDPIRTLFESFFSIALSSPLTSKLYGLFHFSQSPTFPFLEAVRKLLNPEENRPFLDDIYDLMRTHSFSYKFSEYFIQETRNRYKDLGQTYIDQLKTQLSGNDIFDNDTQDNEDNFVPKALDVYTDEAVLDNLKNGNDQDLNFGRLDIIPSLFVLADLQNCPEIFQPLFLTETDLILLDYVNGKVSTLPYKFESCYRVFGESVEQISDIFQGMEPTMSEGQLIIPQLRHLLQDSDPLPDFDTLPTDVYTLSDFINEYLVKRGDIRTLQRRKTNYTQLQVYGPENMELHISKALSKVTMFRRKNISALSAYSYVKRKSGSLNSSAADSRKAVKLILIQNCELVSKIETPHQSNDYIKNPEMVIQDFPEFVTSVQSDPRYQRIRNSKYLNKILLQKLIVKLDMNTYANSRNETPMKKKKISLNDLDKFYEEHLQDRSLINSYLNSIFVPKHYDKFDAATFTRRYIDCYQFDYSHHGYLGNDDSRSHFQEFVNSSKLSQNELIEIYPHPFNPEILAQVGDMVISAFEEPALFRKCDLLSRALTQMLSEMAKYYPPNESVLGSDITAHMHAIILMKVNPPRIATNYAYLTDMVNAFQSTDYGITEIFGGYSASFCLFWSYIREVVEEAEPPKVKFEDFLAYKEQF